MQCFFRWIYPRTGRTEPRCRTYSFSWSIYWDRLEPQHCGAGPCWIRNWQLVAWPGNRPFSFSWRTYRTKPQPCGDWSCQRVRARGRGLEHPMRWRPHTGGSSYWARNLHDHVTNNIDACTWMPDNIIILE